MIDHKCESKGAVSSALDERKLSLRSIFTQVPKKVIEWFQTGNRLYLDYQELFLPYFFRLIGELRFIEQLSTHR